MNKPEALGHSAVADFFHGHCALGTRNGRGFIYLSADHQKAADLLLACGLPLTQLPPGSSRSDAFGRPHEKSGTVAPHADSIAVKVASGVCSLDGHPLHQAGQGIYSVLTHAQVLRVSADRLLLVDNVETFRSLQSYKWIDFDGLNVLAILLGDNFFKENVSMPAVMKRSEPVWAFFDFDPAGLGRACGIPRLERLVLPDSKSLERAVRAAKRSDLFFTHINQWRRTLDEHSNGQISSAWALMSRLQMGLPQEWMVRARRTHLDEATAVSQDRVHATRSCTPCSKMQRFPDTQRDAPIGPTPRSSRPNW